MRYFEDDHELLISAWETVLDASGYLALMDTFEVNCRHWRLVQMAEMFVFCLVLVALQRRASPAAQMWGGILVELAFTFVTWWHSPFLHWRQTALEYLIKAQIFFNLFVGLTLEAGASPVSGDALLVLSNLTTMVGMSFLLNIVSSLLRWIFLSVGRSLDSYVVNFVYSLMDQRWHALEQPNKGLILLQQWDDLIHEQQWQLLQGGGSAKPYSILTRWERYVYLKWAAFRNLTVAKMHSWKGEERTHRNVALLISHKLTLPPFVHSGLNPLHAAMIKGDPLAARWLMAQYQPLLEEVDGAFDTPYICCLRECARRLLMLEEYRSQRLFYEVAKYGEILLSPELQGQRLKWDKRRYKFLRDRANPLLGTLTQLLAVSCNLDPPKVRGRERERERSGAEASLTRSLLMNARRARRASRAWTSGCYTGTAQCGSWPRPW
jgi:hypothetical protein